ncbi:MAG: CapA family protein [Actinobacteria bacterium]|nr:CapA family protein [Actinomycetota bacterium]
MLGRGVDQILPHPGDPTLHESYIRDATGYVELAERANGPIPDPVDFTWPWGEAMSVLDEAAPDVRIINLENAVTRSDDFARGKGIHYRMNPGNLPCLEAADPDVCVLANNHALDLGRSGLEETLDVLSEAELRTAGVGRDLAEAQRPAEVVLEDGGSVLVFALGLPSSGVPGSWAATDDRSGLDFLAEPSPEAAAELTERVRRHERPGDVIVVSLHWGSNWGYAVPEEQTRFAHALIDGGVDVVHGHSSHHPRPIEVYRDRLILYGCGDLINDYEGITGHDEYRDDLRPLYLADVDGDSGALTDLRIVAMQVRKMRLERATADDCAWLRTTLDRVSEDFGTRVVHRGDRELGVAPN